MTILKIGYGCDTKEIKTPVVSVDKTEDFVNAVNAGNCRVVLNKDLTFDKEFIKFNNQVTIDGKGHKITGAQMSLYDVSDIIFYNLAITKSPGDGIRVLRSTTNVIVDCCSISDCYDGTIDASQADKNVKTLVTVSRTRLFDHDKNSLVGDGPPEAEYDKNVFVTWYRNFVYDVDQRSPRVEYATAHVINTYISFKDRGGQSYNYGRLFYEGCWFNALTSKKNATEYKLSGFNNGYIAADDCRTYNGAIIQTNNTSAAREARGKDEYAVTVKSATSSEMAIVKAEAGAFDPDNPRTVPEPTPEPAPAPAPVKKSLNFFEMIIEFFKNLFR